MFRPALVLALVLSYFENAYQVGPLVGKECLDAYKLKSLNTRGPILARCLSRCFQLRMSRALKRARLTCGS
jgi:hypothetical protein